MRFNRQHRYNVPYGHNDNRFSKAYVTKIVNQVEYVQAKIAENDWEFLAMGYGDAIDAAPDNSLIYCDPPYIGLTSTYCHTWDEEKEKGLHDSLTESGCRFMVSSWSHNDYRSNGSSTRFGRIATFPMPTMPISSTGSTSPWSRCC